MSKQAWRYEAFATNTRLIEEFCAKHNLTIEYLNDGYQLRINGAIDIYPVRQKWHYLKTNQRGVYEKIEDLDLTIFYNYRNGKGEYEMPGPAARKLAVREDWPADQPTVTIKWGKPTKKWWQFWKRG